MTQLRPWGIMDDPFDIIWKNFLDNSSNFTTVINSKINYPVDIYEVENTLRFELAVVGLDKDDLLTFKKALLVVHLILLGK